MAPLIVAGAAVQAVEGGAILVATSPVWVPWWLTSVRNERRDLYQLAYSGCVADPVGGSVSGDTRAALPEEEPMAVAERAGACT